MLDLVFVDATEGFSRSLRVVVKPGAENVMVNCEGCTDVAFALQPEHWGTGYALRDARPQVAPPTRRRSSSSLLGRNTLESIERSSRESTGGRNGLGKVLRHHEPRPHNDVPGQTDQGQGPAEADWALFAQNDLISLREEGTPQGSNLSPILSLIVLDELDKHLEGRGLSFCRYADDCNLFVSSRQAGERVLEKTIKFIEGTLKLRVNRSKSGLFRPSKSKFLGYTFVGTSGAPRVAKASFARLMYKLKPILRRGRGRSLLGTIKALTMILRGWRTYYALDDRKEVFERIDIHIRRHLRKLIWRAWKRPKTRERELRRRGLPSEQAWKSSVNGRGPWWNANAPHMLKALPNSVFRRMGLYSLLSKA